ncbi:uncharacterized protein LACBIDRAFT_298611 [Laccaria bicolor S238N-H82]|uniref:Predicted protein n=1 Tax=Laccaria bicolor (strain S238N-H82 / ATCC MYA-4686) TaxID=486041 RepID=B0DD81_LACBS|nr:uncharacterized protein LACBIDRAFT_298611 [Laccaria bicolor S238N-H82]EDR07432.1 predicted protein [Laccaria bicolor S238N-H82]|eukprot:XP_001881824.1 predicted protein [Laccaria bicolor S238N-H82]
MFLSGCILHNRCSLANDLSSSSRAHVLPNFPVHTRTFFQAMTTLSMVVTTPCRIDQRGVVTTV